ncbi:ABC transporter permease subunit [Microbacterium sp. X-17]|uniref:ABC transporter permease subunit n=1 Tax=Microbacterium sp. X-17 TaxID=3144404 RepID=UPI0031F57099
MTALATAPADTRTAVHPHLNFARVLRSEWIKVTTVRSTWWSLLITAVLSIGLSLLIAGVSNSVPGGVPPVRAIVSPMQFTMLVAGILGAIVVTGEYSTGMIRSTLTAEPRRDVVILAKAVVVAVLLALTTIVIYAVAIVVTAPILHTQIDWSTPRESIVPLVFGVVSMVAFALIGLGFGFLIRNGAGAIATTVGVLFVLPLVFSLFSLAGDGWHWLVDLAQYLPSNAAQNLTSTTADLWPAWLALLVWVLVPLVGGWVTLRTRDA